MPAPRLANGAPLPATAAPTPNTHAARVEDVFYPSSDGKPMAENMSQSRAIINTVGDIEDAHPKALVAADILVYPEEGNNKNSIAPDVLVGLGLGTVSRTVYKVWEEGKPPDWVLEVASPSTQTKDRGTLLPRGVSQASRRPSRTARSRAAPAEALSMRGAGPSRTPAEALSMRGAGPSRTPAEGSKPERYAAMGVPEYWLFDPTGDTYPRGTPRLQGFELVDGEYRPLESRLVDGKRMIRSEVLGLNVYAEDELLRFRDPATGQDIQRRQEVKAAAALDRARAVREAAQRKTAEARAEREANRAEREIVQRKAAEARAEREADRAEREAARAEQEAAARSAADARVAELEAVLRRSQSEQPP